MPGKYGQGQVNSVFNIPVIVHIIHNNETVNTSTATTGNNLNAAQIINQINILNQDFNGTNADTSLIPSVFKPAQGKFQFNFCLAVVNPTGGVLTEPGIDRINRNTKGWTAPPYTTTYISNTIKPNSIWDPTKYLNMWVCAISGGVLGYATFPNPGTSGLSGIPSPYGSTSTDGLVMRNTAFGSIGTAGSGVYNKGRTATHEIGHWLGLRHIWGDGTCATDYCTDTPPAQNANYGCPTHPYKLGTCTGNSTGEMTMNYMDYTDDACMYMFTNGQKNRAQLIMTNSSMRASLLTSTVCSLPTTTNEIGILYIASPSYSQNINCNNYINPVVAVHNFGSNTITSATFSYNVDGQSTQTYSWTGSLSPNTSATVALPQINNLNNGSHIYYAGVYSPNGGTDPNVLNNSNNQAFTISNSFTMAISGPTSVCSGNSTTLTANGTAGSYSWNPGAVSGSVFVVTPTSATIYTLTGKTGTCVNTRTVMVSITSPPVISAPSTTICAGNSNTISASGACTYTYNPGALTSPPSPTITTTYTVLGSCMGGCVGSGTGTITVTQPPVINMAVSPTGSLCPGGTASITASGAGSYTWSTGQTSNPLVVTPLVSTVYTVTGAIGSCVNTKTVSVSVGGSTLNISILPNLPTVCLGSSITLSGAGASTYSWSTGSNTTSLTVSPSTTTTYSLIGANGACTATAVTTVSVVASLVINVTANPPGAICAGTSVSLSVSGAAGYLWNTGSSSNIIIVSPTATTVYTVTGTTQGCTDTKTIGITVGNAVSILINASTASVCPGSSATLNATGALSYTWNTGSTSSSLVVNPLQTTTYSVSGGSGNCIGSSAITISVSPIAPLNISPDATLCIGKSATLTAGGAYTNYAWNNFPPGASVIVTPTATASYTVNALGSPAGCSTSSIVVLTVTNNPVTSLITMNSVCDICTGKINATTSGGTGPYSYSLSNGCAVPCYSLCPGLYTIYTTDASECKTINYFSIECSGLSTGLKNEEEEPFLIYPQPAAQYVNIQSPETISRYELYDASGRLIKTGDVASDTVLIELGTCSKGIYLIRINTVNNKTFIKKLVID